MRFKVYWVLIITAFPVIFSNPFWGCVIYSAGNIIRPELLFWGNSAAAGNSMKVVLIVTVLGVLFKSNQFDFHSTLLRREILLMVWFYAAIILSIVLSDYRIPLVYNYANEIMKLTVLCAMISITVNNYEKIIKYENILLVVIVLLGIWGIQQHYLGNSRLEKLGGYDSNGVAALFVFFSPLALNKFYTSVAIKQKIIGILCVLILLTVIIFTQSRGGLLGTIAAFFAFVIRTNKPIRTIIAGLTIGILLTTVVVSTDYKERMGTISHDSSKMDGSSQSRLILWTAGIMIFSDNVLFGSGHMTFPLEKLKYKHRFNSIDGDLRESVFRTDSPLVTHNTYISILSDSGLFAFAPYVTLILGTLIANRKARKIYNKDYNTKSLIDLLGSIDAGIIGVCVCNMFINNAVFIFLFVQIIVCATIRQLLYEKMQNV